MPTQSLRRTVSVSHSPLRTLVRTKQRCSAIEALDRQEPFINQTLASSALAMLARLFRYGKLNHHGAFFNAETGRMSALPIDPQMWTKVRRRNRRLRVAA